jgi:hypothetical protein
MCCRRCTGAPAAGRPVRIGQERPPERNEIRLPVGKRGHGLDRMSKPAGGDDRHRDVLFHRRSEMQERGIRHGHRRDHHGGGGQRPVVSAGDMDGVCARRLDPTCELTRLVYVDAVGKVIVAVKAKDDTDTGRPVTDPTCHLDREAGPVFQGAAELIVAPIFGRRQELRYQVTVGAVNFDHVEAGTLGPQGRRTEGLDGLFDAANRHLLRDDSFGVALLNGMRDGRWRERRLTRNVAPRMPPAMAELNGDRGARLVKRLHQPTQPGQKFIVVNTQFEVTMPAGRLRRRHLHGNEADAAFGAADVIGDHVLGDESIPVRAPRRHRRQDKTIFQLNRAYTPRIEQQGPYNPGLWLDRNTLAALADDVHDRIRKLTRPPASTHLPR